MTSSSPENHVAGRKPTPRPIGMGSYNMDSHNTQRYVDASGHARNEGDIQVSPGGPYPIDYGAIIPKAVECQNLLVPVCLSSSHIAFGSIRMEPVFMILGQSAAHRRLARDRCRLVGPRRSRTRSFAGVCSRDGQVLEHAGRRAKILPRASLKGVLADDAQIVNKDDWIKSQSVSPFVEYGYRHDGNARKGELVARFSPAKLEAGTYEVRISYTPHGNRATNVPVTVTHAGGTTRAQSEPAAQALGGRRLPFPGPVPLRDRRPPSGADQQRGAPTATWVIDAVQWLKVDEE